VPPCALAAMEPAGVPGVDASPSAPPPWRPGYCTHVPGILTVGRLSYPGCVHPLRLCPPTASCGPRLLHFVKRYAHPFHGVVTCYNVPLKELILLA